MSQSLPTSPSIACLLCGEEMSRALQSILVMLKPYLTLDWRVETSVEDWAAVRIVNLDHPEGAQLLASFGPQQRAIGCAQHPRQHAPGTIHRPLRAYEILSSLKEMERTGVGLETQHEDAPARVLEADRARSFKLTYWPNEFEGWSCDWWRILACLRSRRLTAAQLVQELDLPYSVVAECLDHLLRTNAVTVKFDMQAITPASRGKRSWRSIGTRLVGLLRTRA